MSNIRVGIGYDVHRLVDGKSLVLGGIIIPYNKKLEGHSDADVLIHAIIDALLGAANLGDIGEHFSDQDKQFKNISSLKLLKIVKEEIEDNFYKIINIDTIIIAQAPKLSSYKHQMKKVISQCLNIKANQISIKATTEEGLGFTGEKLGIAAQAVCLLEKGK